jgi:hypothetical protein
MQHSASTPRNAGRAVLTIAPGTEFELWHVTLHELDLRRIGTLVVSEFSR